MEGWIISVTPVKRRYTKVSPPTKEQRSLVSALVAYGAGRKSIAQILEISEDAMMAHYRHELETGDVRANMKVAERLFQSAMDGNVVAMTFWLRCRAGWRDVAKLEIEDISRLSDSELLARAKGIVDITDMDEVNALASGKKSVSDKMLPKRQKR